MVNLEMSQLGWIHSLLCVLALVAGLLNIVLPKGKQLHRRIGQIYVVSLIAVCVTSLGIYRGHKFWFPHWTALITLGLIAIAWCSVRFKWPKRSWIYVHQISMLLSYYMLIGGGVNEVFLRVDFLHRLAGMDPATFLRSRILGLAHFTIMLVFIVLILAFPIATAIDKKRRRRRDQMPEVVYVDHT